MKKIKGLRSLLFVLLTTAIMIASAFAGEITYTITLSDTQGTYNAYLLYSATYSGDNAAYTVNDLYAEAIASAVSTQTDAVAYLEKLTDNSKDLDTFASSVVNAINKSDLKATATSSNGIIEGLEPGYYLIVDASSRNGQEDSAYSKYILETVKENLEVTVKSSLPTVEKKVYENTKSVTETTDSRISDYVIPTGYNDVADYSIGDTVPFLLVGTLPSTYDDYSTYKYIFHDTLSSGLTFVAGSVKVYLDTVNGTEITSLFSVEESKGVLTISANDLKKNTSIKKTSKIVVTYDAELNSNAVIGLEGNPNEVYLEYSNNPNYTGTGSNTSDGGDGDDSTGKTTIDKVIVFTYELDVTKVDSNDDTKTLPGAKFVLKNATGNEAKYAEVVDGKFAGWSATKTDNCILESGENGLFTIAGLDDGTYYLEETDAPEGYKQLSDDIKVVISANTVNNQKWEGKAASAALTGLSISAYNTAAVPGTTNTSNGVVSLTIKNTTGSLLPTTGGIGTTILYVIGAILVICAGVALITKKRVKDSE